MDSLIHELTPLEIFLSVPGAVQSVQRADLWDVTLASQSLSTLFVGVDNLKVGSSCWQAGDMLSHVHQMIARRDPTTFRVGKVKDHAPVFFVRGLTGGLPKSLLTTKADLAAALCRRRQLDSDIDACAVSFCPPIAQFVAGFSRLVVVLVLHLIHRSGLKEVGLKLDGLKHVCVTSLGFLVQVSGLVDGNDLMFLNGLTMWVA